MDRSLPFWLRAFFLLVTLQALVVAAGIVWPALISQLLPWDASPLNARFIAALYAMGGLSALLCLLARRYTEVRIILIQIGLVTLLLLLITIPRLGEFTPPRSFPIGWVLSYTIDPLLAALLLWQMRGHDHTSVDVIPSRWYLVSMRSCWVRLASCCLRFHPSQHRFGRGSCQQCWGSSIARSFSAWRCARCSRHAESRWEAVRIYAIAQLFLLVLVNAGLAAAHRPLSRGSRHLALVCELSG